MAQRVVDLSLLIEDNMPAHKLFQRPVITTPAAGPSTAIMETALSGGAEASVRHTTQRTSAPLRSQPEADEIQLFRPRMIQRSLSSLAVVRTPSPGGGDAALALPPVSVAQKPASGAPLFLKNETSSRSRCSPDPPEQDRKQPE